MTNPIILSQFNAVQFQFYLHSIDPVQSHLVLSSHLHLSVPSGFISWDLQTNILYEYITLICATFPEYHTIIHLIALTLLGGKHKLRHSHIK
jgi:hypothetical protein